MHLINIKQFEMKVRKVVMEITQNVGESGFGESRIPYLGKNKLKKGE